MLRKNILLWVVYLMVLFLSLRAHAVDSCPIAGQIKLYDECIEPTSEYNFGYIHTYGKNDANYVTPISSPQDVLETATTCNENEFISGIRYQKVWRAFFISPDNWYSAALKPSVLPTGLYCSDKDFRERFEAIPIKYHQPAVDLLLPQEYDLKCPWGFVVSGIEGVTTAKDVPRSHGAFFGFRLYCKNWDSFGLNDEFAYPSDVAFHFRDEYYSTEEQYKTKDSYHHIWWSNPMNFYGAAAGKEYLIPVDVIGQDKFCKKGYALRKLLSHNDREATFNIGGGKCFIVPKRFGHGVEKPLQPPLILKTEETETGIVFGNSQQNGTYTSQCSAGDVLVGLAVGLEKNKMGTIGAICADPDSFISEREGAYEIVRQSPRRLCGDGGGERKDMVCPPGYFLKKIHYNRGDIFTGIRGECYPLDYRGPFGLFSDNFRISTLTYGTETTQENLFCLGGRFPVGLNVWMKGNSVGSMQGLCQVPDNEIYIAPTSPPVNQPPSPSPPLVAPPLPAPAPVPAPAPAPANPPPARVAPSPCPEGCQRNAYGICMPLPGYSGQCRAGQAATPTPPPPAQNQAGGGSPPDAPAVPPHPDSGTESSKKKSSAKTDADDSASDAGNGADEKKKSWFSCSLNKGAPPKNAPLFGFILLPIFWFAVLRRLQLK